MYGWIWRQLPGAMPVKAVLAVLMVAGTVLLLFEVVFPWAEPRLPFGEVTVDGTSPEPAPPTP